MTTVDLGRRATSAQARSFSSSTSYDKVETATGSLSRKEAIAQIITLPVALTIGLAVMIWIAYTAV